MKKIPLEILVCPQCSGKLIDLTTALRCGSCGHEYPIVNKQLHFKTLIPSDISDDLDALKHALKKFSKMYLLLIQVVSPVFLSFSAKKILDRYVTNDDSVALNLGSGNSKVSDKLLNVDIFAYDNVRIICDIATTPFADNTVDFVLNIAVLEHVSSPEKVVAEILRILKKGGTICSYLPFIAPFHASPYDFSRRTIEGMKVLFRDFETVSLTPAGGPTSGLLWVFQEWLALVLSFGNKRVHLLASLIIMVLTFPFKYIDYLLIRHPMAHTISSGFLFIGKKR